MKDVKKIKLQELPISVILIDDEQAILESVSQTLRLAGHYVENYKSVEMAKPRLSPNLPIVVISDIRMPKTSGLDLLNLLVKMDDELPVILLTGHGDVEMAVAAMHDGAWDFLQKPVQPQTLIESVERAVKQRKLVLKNRTLQAELRRISHSDQMASKLIGVSPQMIELKASTAELAQVDANIVIRGETGTGKDVVARCLHEFGPRCDWNFVALNCGAIPTDLIESELFGHESSANLDSDTKRMGRLEQANGGTIFLDEVEAMPMELQVKLLRALQERTFEPKGGNRNIPFDVRVIAATKADLHGLCKEGKFREDLFYQLQVVEINVPPLRELQNDILLVFRNYAERAALKFNRELPPVNEFVDQELLNYSWPGNIRELIGAADRFVLGLPLSREIESNLGQFNKTLTLAERLEEYEKSLIKRAMDEAGGSMQKAADILHIPYKTLYLRTKKYGLNKKEFS